MQYVKSLVVAALAIAATNMSIQESQAQRFGHSGAVNRTGAGTAAYWVSHSTWGDYWARNNAMTHPWHGDYYYLKTGQPTALVVPPTIQMQQNYSWGVSQNTMTPVWHQFGPGAPAGSAPGQFKATPYWPSHTNQFGVYPVRGPW